MSDLRLAADIGTNREGKPIKLVLCVIHLEAMVQEHGGAPFPFAPYEGDKGCYLCASVGPPVITYEWEPKE